MNILTPTDEYWVDDYFVVKARINEFRSDVEMKLSIARLMDEHGMDCLKPRQVFSEEYGRAISVAQQAKHLLKAREEEMALDEPFLMAGP